ncbi:hypothetical protein BG011_002953 [Mortierella polycephala]|uniref:phosphatidylserine decarboxylase n=1 Tax=Mortierella polycephala TaxID=41804 RepID=A0A9P6QFS8_9FUNG|nr:hypothetical protein BG011_002953 [Mortierella polycephala]
MLKSFSTSLKDKLSRRGEEHVKATTTTEISTNDNPPTTALTTTTTDSIVKTTVEDTDSDQDTDFTVAGLAVNDISLSTASSPPAPKATEVTEIPPSSPTKITYDNNEPRPSKEYHGVRKGLQRVLETFTHKETTTTTTIQEQEPGEVTVDIQEVASEVSFTAKTISPASSATSVVSYPGTINAKFVKEQSIKQSMDGLRHALSASIEKSAPAKKSGRLFKGGILTNANSKKWFHAKIPVYFVQKLTSEHRFGNYVITNRKTGAKTWEDMPIYARIGIHLVFACVLDPRLLYTHKIQHLFSAESVRQGKHFNAPESVAQIAYFIKAYKLDLSELLQPDLSQYKSFNDFFYRRLRPDARPIHEKENPNTIVSSADCRLCVFESITAATQVWVKGKSFTIEHLVRDTALAAQFEGGSIALFRLAPQDYHRFHSPVSGRIANDSVKIDGTYFTVNPMAVNNEGLDVFTENVRKVTVIDLEQHGEGENRNEHFDKAVFVSIGALLVGSVVLTGANNAGTKVEKGDELGYFAYGGSTCILLFKAGAVEFDEDLVASSQTGIETLVRMGERIGVRK